MTPFRNFFLHHSEQEGHGINATHIIAKEQRKTMAIKKPVKAKRISKLKQYK